MMIRLIKYSTNFSGINTYLNHHETCIFTYIFFIHVHKKTWVLQHSFLTKRGISELLVYTFSFSTYASRGSTVLVIYK